MSSGRDIAFGTWKSSRHSAQALYKVSDNKRLLASWRITPMGIFKLLDK